MGAERNGFDSRRSQIRKADGDSGVRLTPSSTFFGVQVLLRKGGIREPRFLVPSVEFLIQPTAFHLDAELLRPEYREIYTAVRRALKASLRTP